MLEDQEGETLPVEHVTGAVRLPQSESVISNTMQEEQNETVTEHIQLNNNGQIEQQQS